ncbi:MAG: exodeoxyribonuclease VII small subunit [Synergistaceae bacterium]
MNFTQKMQELDKVLQKIDDNNITLEDAMQEFESGIKLIKECKTYLDNASQKVKILTDESEIDFKERIGE